MILGRTNRFVDGGHLGVVPEPSHVNVARPGRDGGVRVDRMKVVSPVIHKARAAKLEYVDQQRLSQWLMVFTVCLVRWPSWLSG